MRLTVVVPVYNHQRYVEEAVQSALHQTRPPDEVLCIDDGSTDGSFAVVQRLAAAHPEVRCWTRPNRGAHATLNEGLQEASGELVAILNSDDAWDEGRLEICADVLESDRSLDLVCTGLSFLDETSRQVRNPWYDEALAFHKKVGDPALSLVHANFLCTSSNFVFRKALPAQVGPFDALRYCHDLDFLLRVLDAGRGLAILEERLIGYRLHPKNTVQESQREVRVEFAAVAAFHAQRLAAAAPPGDERCTRLCAVIDGNGLGVTPLVARALLELQARPSASPGTLLQDPAVRAALRALLR